MVFFHCGCNCGFDRSANPAKRQHLLGRFEKTSERVPSHKAEPFKAWLAMVGRERIEETIDPEQAIVVNSVSISRDLPVVTGFFEIIRVVIN